VAEPTFFDSAQAWRRWLAEHHETASECLVGFAKVGTGRASMTWSESVDQALCFGWIDGVRRRVDEHTYTIRFTPRKPSSTWSTVNVRKVERLRATGEMTPAGERAFAARRQGNTGIYAYEREAQQLSAGERRRFEAEPAAWAYFCVQAPWYRRTATHWVVAAKRAETRERRLAQLIADSAQGRRLRQLDRDRRQ
jgi:uncharacterized protein YdeI (YjbR/CyaY-like superfamily)